MKKTLAITIAIAIMVLAFSTNTLYANEISTDTHQIQITTNDNQISIKETIKIQGNSNENYETITFWIQNGAKNIKININNTQIAYTASNNEYTCNISSMNIKQNTLLTVILNYNLEKQDENFFEKQIMRNTTKISITIDGENKLTAEDTIMGSSFTFQIDEISEENQITLYLAILIILLIILLAVLMTYKSKKQQKTKTKDTLGASEELLSTKKTLLMTLLKDIEKQHRANKISDDTYHKLKEQYKHEAVEAMKKLEDMKS
jgi:hypothetical protein